jgi:tRNA A-37 threonylcarbamoyl transferase component Bud32
MTNKLLSYSYYDFTRNEALLQALSKMFGTSIAHAEYKSNLLYGGTVGDVRLVAGSAETTSGEKLPYKIVVKYTHKWGRHNDPDSWRREYDLYKSDFGALFTDSLRWPVCYHAVINEDETETQLWMEYIDGVSGLDLTGGTYERAAEELGRFQGRLYSERPAVLQNLINLSKIEFSKKFYLHYRSWKKVYDYIRSENCEIPKHLCQMLIDIDENEKAVWEHIEKLPVVLCHRDFWVTNIFYKDGNIVLIDWDTSGWGYLGEDIASLIADEADVENMVEYYHKCTAAYYKGFSEYADVTRITGWSDASRPARPCVRDNCVRELIIVMFGYRFIEWYLSAETPEDKALQLNSLQKIYEMENVK